MSNPMRKNTFVSHAADFQNGLDKTPEIVYNME